MSKDSRFSHLAGSDTSSTFGRSHLQQEHFSDNEDEDSVEIVDSDDEESTNSSPSIAISAAELPRPLQIGTRDIVSGKAERCLATAEENLEDRPSAINGHGHEEQLANADEIELELSRRVKHIEERYLAQAASLEQNFSEHLKKLQFRHQHEVAIIRQEVAKEKAKIDELTKKNQELTLELEALKDRNNSMADDIWRSIKSINHIG